MRAKKPAHYHGLLLIDKPSGWTSHDVVGKLRRLANQRQIGHTGTLDPMATGLMGVLMGSATRLEPWLTKMDKVYSGQLALGLTTDTDDVTGLVVAQWEGDWPAEAKVRETLALYQGSGLQVPPAYSAVQVNGQRAYKAARAGQPLELAGRQVTAHRLELTKYEAPLIDFVAEVSSGYYIRSLARDVGAALEVGGALSSLRRLSVGPWTVAEAFTLEQVEKWSGSDWDNYLKPPAQALPHLSGLILNQTEAAYFAQGRKIALDGHWVVENQTPFDIMVAPDRACGEHEPPLVYKILNPAGQLLGLGELNPSLGGLSPQVPYLRPLRVFVVNEV